MTEPKYAAIHYQKYLQIDKILSAQKLRSDELGEHAHDEMLFIILHQVYELWFKQIIYEIDAVIEQLASDNVDEKEFGKIIYKLDRVVEILKILIDQIKIIESISQLDFLDFRDYLFPASGFQSFQFRKLEILLGLEDEKRVLYNNKPYYEAFQPKEREQILDIEPENTLKHHVLRWLERTPFIDVEGFKFIDTYKDALKKMLEREKRNIKNSKFLTDEQMKGRLDMLGTTETYYKTVLDKQYHAEQVAKGNLDFSYRATLAALFIRLYRDEPLLYLPNMFLNKIAEIDEYLIAWRHRHAQMVLKQLGNKMGTGGSSGHKYLLKTAEKHHIFSDIHNISTLMIATSQLPKLPDNVKKELSYYYNY